MAALPTSERIAVIVPALNEVENVEPLVRQILECLPNCAEIIIVDDGSTDGTPARVRELAVSLPVCLLERANPAFGLAGAVIAGARLAQAPVLVVMDADLSHPPSQIEHLIEPLLDDRADLVVGSRYVRGGSTPGWPVYRRVMSRTAAALAYP
ncbi:MAG TPA: glycosyltransferase, partial [Chthoniobacterales bacterium]|nr:glycosyltransferase [Chthoniobacterales bacterium]